MKTPTRWVFALIAATVLTGLVSVCSTAHAGPPLICHPVEIGDATSLPWGSDAFDQKRDYDLSQLLDDTVEILDNEQGVLVHMETLRRAALYARRDLDLATRMLAALMARALDAEANGEPDGLAWLDAGYLAQCYHQLELKIGIPDSESHGVVGYGWVRRALMLRRNDAEMEFAAAMVTVFARIPEHDQHVARVRALAAEDSLVARNLRILITRYWPHHRPDSHG
ncbi:MAG: hypothetical protein ACYS0G_14560 [Planctomycetota bacterium]|jgi:hypothetical protein